MIQKMIFHLMDEQKNEDEHKHEEDEREEEESNGEDADGGSFRREGVGGAIR